jgi:hypothetical protein
MLRLRLSGEGRNLFHTSNADFVPFSLCLPLLNLKLLFRYMDPLSISTGIITLLQATTTIISVYYNFRAALKDRPWSLTRIIDELKCLRNILESSEELAQSVDSPSGLGTRPVVESLSEPDNGPLLILTQTLSARIRCLEWETEILKLRRNHWIEEKFSSPNFRLAAQGWRCTGISRAYWKV